MAAGALLILAAPGYAECQPEWSDAFGASGPDDVVYALVVFDDGTGPALYAGGAFQSAGGTAARHLARWNGAVWSPLPGAAGNGTNGPVYALTVYDDGAGPALYAGGAFTEAGGVAASRVARWDGTGWSTLSGPADNGVTHTVYALAVCDDGRGPALYAGGAFTAAGGVPANHVARWDAAGWSALAGAAGNGTNGFVHALATYDDGGGPAVFVGGYFTQAGGIAANRLARWDGADWSPLSGLDNGMDGGVTALTVYNDGSGPALYAGGSFMTAGGVWARRIARWDGIGWSGLDGPHDTGVNGPVFALLAHDDGTGPALYAAGGFTDAGGKWARHVARWRGGGWSAVGAEKSQGTDDDVHALTAYADPVQLMLYAGGRFTQAGDTPARRVAKWIGTVWLPPGLGGLNKWVSALAVYDDGGGRGLYVGGGFSKAGATVAASIARWDGTGWSPLLGPKGNGTNGSVAALVVYDDGAGPALYAGGKFTTAGGIAANHVARWDGTAWSPLSGPAGNGTDGSVGALLVYDDGGGPALYAGGQFTAAGGVGVNFVAKWDGAGWSALAVPPEIGVDGCVKALAVYDDGRGPALYAAGSFTMAGGVPAKHVARWDGTAWSALAGPSGYGLSHWGNALTPYDDGTGPALYVGGFFTKAGGVWANSIARWDGTAWSALAGPGGDGVKGTVQILAVHDDGHGAALYVGGAFTEAAGLGANSIARWDGQTWSTLAGPAGEGISGGVAGPDVSALAGYHDGGVAGPALYAGGYFTAAGGLTSYNIARWGCPYEVGDVDCSGGIDALDIEPFILALTDAPGYQAAYPNCDIDLADMNGDRLVDAFDIDPFVALLTGP